MSCKQKRKPAKTVMHRFSDGFAVSIFTFIFLFWLAFSIKDILVCNNINKGNLKEFTGEFKIDELHRRRNTVYHIYLDNGDIVRVLPDLLEDTEDLTHYSKLHFIYSTPQLSFIPLFTCVEITNSEGDLVFFSPETALKEATGGIFLGLFFVVLLALPVIWISYLSIIIKRKPSRK